MQKLGQTSVLKGKALEEERDAVKSEFADKIRALEDKLEKSAIENSSLKQEMEKNVKAKIDDVILEKNLEKAKVEEDFAKQVSEIRSHKDDVIQKLKEKLREKVEMNKKLSAESKILAGRLKEQESAYQLLEQVCRNKVSVGL